MPVTNYIWDVESDNCLMETDGSNVTQAVYTNEPVQFGNLISQRRGSTTNYCHFDALGSTRELTYGTQAVTDTFTYDAWGNEVTHTGSTVTPFRWGGEIGYNYDETIGNEHIRTRVYHPAIGRWTSSDPARFDDGVNLYLYSHNNAVVHLDPSGELTITRVPRNTGASFRSVSCSVRTSFRGIRSIANSTKQGRLPKPACPRAACVHLSYGY